MLEDEEDAACRLMWS